jgi:hypothetical protein
MRFVFSIVFCFIACTVAAQEVRISPDVARYFLEQSDKVDILTKKDSLNTTIIENLNFTISTKNLLIKNLDSQVDIQEMMLKVRSKEVELRDDEIKGLKKQVRKEKLKSTVTVIVSGVIVILILL